MVDLSDAQEVGRRIGAARGWCLDTAESFAAKLSLSTPTLRDYEKGKLGNWAGSPAKHRALLEHVQELTGVPDEVIGLSEPGESVAIELRDAIEALDDQLTTLRANLSTVQTDLADARKHQGLPVHAKEATGG